MSDFDDQQHQDALDQTGFWGKKGAGSIIMARTTSRLLIQKRSTEVEEPGTWGTWGGAIDSGLSPREGVLKEFEQETGKSRRIIREIVPLWVFQDKKSGFTYHNFLFIVDDEFTPLPDSHSAWEIDGFKWVPFGRWPHPLHFGLQGVIEHSAYEIKAIVDKNLRGD
jgi:8-oxo-dGTP pyrophosphatase MutT (NUDIX family)